jgi:hypothetical protein
MKTIKYTCPICNKEQEIAKYSFLRKKTKFCQNCVSTGTQKGIKRPQFSRENSGRWFGGEYVSSDGYKMIKMEGEFHPSGRQKYKRESVLVYEKILGRELKTSRGYHGEQIHHIDGNKLNNSIDNLEFCSNITEHRNLHGQLEEVSYELIRRGVIIYDKTTKKYKINESRIT